MTAESGQASEKTEHRAEGKYISYTNNSSDSVYSEDSSYMETIEVNKGDSVVISITREIKKTRIKRNHTKSEQQSDSVYSSDSSYVGSGSYSATIEEKHSASWWDTFKGYVMVALLILVIIILMRRMNNE